MGNSAANANVLNPREESLTDTVKHSIESKSIMIVDEKDSIFSILQLGFKKATEDKNVTDGEGNSISIHD